MSIFFWNDNKKIDNFAFGLADHFFKTIPPGRVQEDKVDKKIFKKFDHEVSKMLMKLEKFHSKNKLGVYKRARLHNSLLNRLRELGYEKEFVHSLNEKLLVYSINYKK